jgi:hypothetical protein
LWLERHRLQKEKQVDDDTKEQAKLDCEERMEKERRMHERDMARIRLIGQLLQSGTPAHQVAALADSILHTGGSPSNGDSSSVGNQNDADDDN